MRSIRAVHDHYDDTDVDLTPMLDVVFIMLIFFIVTASFIKEYGIAFNKGSNDDRIDPSAPIIVALNGRGQVWVDDIPASIGTVQQHA